MIRILMAEATDYRAPMQVGSHALARQFVTGGAAGMWVGTPIYPHTLARQADPFTRRRINVWRSGGVTHDAVTEYYPFTLLPVMNRPIFRSAAVARNTLRATVPPVASVIRRHGFSEPDLLWLSASRFSHPMMSLVRASKCAYRMSDDWASFPGVPRSLIDLEARIIDSVDAVFVSGRVLEARVRERRPDVVYLPNGVDDAFFDAAPAVGPPADRHPHPRVVFAGTLGDWIDYGAIDAAARRNPNASFLLVGAGRSARGRVLPENVHVTGPVAYDQLPAVIAASDVGIVPFLRTRRTDAASSNKIFQYLAGGLPVVTTRTTEIAQSGAPVTICDDAATFADAVADAVENRAAGRDQRIAFARNHTWARRADIVRSALGMQA